jgi:endonuclease YncB( thermonuclease family)
MGQTWSDLWLKRRLRTKTKKNTRRFVPRFRWAKVVNVYDGDTVTLAAVPGKGKECFLFRCRLARIDAPEMTKQSGKTKRARDRK